MTNSKTSKNTPTAKYYFNNNNTNKYSYGIFEEIAEKVVPRNRNLTKPTVNLSCRR